MGGCEGLGVVRLVQSDQLAQDLESGGVGCRLQRETSQVEYEHMLPKKIISNEMIEIITSCLKTSLVLI